MIQTNISGGVEAVKTVITSGASTVVGDLEKFVVQEFAKFLASVMSKFGSNAISASNLTGTADHGGANLSAGVSIINYPAGSNDTPAVTAPVTTPTV